MQPLVMPNEICRLLSGAKTARVTEKGLHAMISPFVFWLRDIFLRTDADAASDRVVRWRLSSRNFFSVCFCSAWRVCLLFFFFFFFCWCLLPGGGSFSSLRPPPRR